MHGLSTIKKLNQEAVDRHLAEGSDARKAADERFNSTVAQAIAERATKTAADAAATGQPVAA